MNCMTADDRRQAETHDKGRLKQPQKDVRRVCVHCSRDKFVKLVGRPRNDASVRIVQEVHNREDHKEVRRLEQRLLPSRWPLHCKFILCILSVVPQHRHALIEGSYFALKTLDLAWGADSPFDASMPPSCAVRQGRETN